MTSSLKEIILELVYMGRLFSFFFFFYNGTDAQCESVLDLQGQDSKLLSRLRLDIFIDS